MGRENNSKINLFLVSHANDKTRSGECNFENDNWRDDERSHMSKLGNKKIQNDLFDVKQISNRHNRK